MDLSLEGFLVDEQRRAELEQDVERQCARLKTAIRAATPFDLFGKGKRKGEEGKGLSSVKVMAYFYEYLRCKKYYKKGGRGERTATADEEAIRRLMRAYKKARAVGQLVLDWRMWDKRGDFLQAKRLDDDHRMRGLYVPTAVSGQLQCSTNPLGTGSNMQNPPRPPSPVRSIFIPNRGHILVELDFSRIENRLLYGMSGDPKLVRAAQPEWRGDEYVDVAERLAIAEAFDDMFGPTTTEDDTVELKRPSIRAYYVRQTGKRTLLAGGFDMQGLMMSRALLLETEGALALDPRQCDAWLVALKTKIKPGIQKYHEWIRSRILTDGYLENSWGRRVYFRKLRLAHGDYRDGFAWCCQSEDRTATNILGMRFARDLIRREGLDAVLVQNGHDALVGSVEPSISWDFTSAMAASMGQSREYPGAGGSWQLACPIGWKIGPRWGGDMHEWKKKPSRAEFEEQLGQALEVVWWNRRRKLYHA